MIKVNYSTKALRGEELYQLLSKFIGYATMMYPTIFETASPISKIAKNNIEYVVTHFVSKKLIENGVFTREEVEIKKLETTRIPAYVFRDFEELRRFAEANDEYIEQIKLYLDPINKRAKEFPLSEHEIVHGSFYELMPVFCKEESRSFPMTVVCLPNPSNPSRLCLFNVENLIKLHFISDFILRKIDK